MLQLVSDSYHLVSHGATLTLSTLSKYSNPIFSNLPQLSLSSNSLIRNITLGALVSIGTIGLGLTIYDCVSRPKHWSKIPQDKMYPYFGSFFEFIKYSKNGDPLGEVMRDRQSKYGNVFGFSVMGVYFLVINDAAAVNKYLRTDERLVKRDDFLAKVLYGVMVTPLFLLDGGPKWKKHRKLLQPAFGPAQLRYTLDVTADQGNQLVNHWKEKIANDKDVEIEVSAYFAATAIDLLGKIAFSHDFGSLSALNSNQISEDPIVQMNKLIVDRKPIPPFMWEMMGLGYSTGLAIRKKLEAILVPLIEQRKSNNVVEKDALNAKSDLLDRLISKNGSAESLTDNEIVDETMGFFFAGHETTSNSLTWIIYALCNHPEVIEKAQRHIDEILKGGVPTWEDLGNLNYIEAIIKEVQRCHPVVPFNLRQVEEDMEICGYIVSKGVLVCSNLESIGMDERYWDQPELFMPERFLNGSVIVPGSFVPFGDGKHNCIGQKMAMIEMKVILTLILQNFDFQLVPNQTLIPKVDVTKGLKDGLKLKLKTRK